MLRSRRQAVGLRPTTERDNIGLGPWNLPCLPSKDDSPAPPRISTGVARTRVGDRSRQRLAIKRAEERTRPPCRTEHFDRWRLRTRATASNAATRIARARAPLISGREIRRRRQVRWSELAGFNRDSFAGWNLKRLEAVWFCGNITCDCYSGTMIYDDELTFFLIFSNSQLLLKNRKLEFYSCFSVFRDIGICVYRCFVVVDFDVPLLSVEIIYNLNYWTISCVFSTGDTFVFFNTKPTSKMYNFRE